MAPKVYLVRVTLTSEVSSMARRMAFSAFCIAAVTTLAGCVDSASIQKNTVSAQTWVAAGSNASSFGVQNAGFTVINFEFDSDELTAEALVKLGAQAAWIGRHPNIRFGVTGHTDLVGDVDYNMELGMRRAERVVAVLMNAGVNERQLVAQVSQGELEPVVDTDNREAANRRTTTEFLEYISNQNSTDRPEKRDRESPTYYSVADNMSPKTETVVDEVDEPITSDQPEGSKTQKTDNSDANGKGGSKHNRNDKEKKGAHETAENKKSAKSDFQ